MNPTLIVTSNPKHADVIEASGEVFELVRQTRQEVPCQDRCQLARPHETLSPKCVVDCRKELTA